MIMEEQAAEGEGSIEREHARLLSMQFGVMRKILVNLPARDLGRAALVCHAWNDVCRIIRRERQSPHWFEWHRTNTKGKSAMPSIRSKINEEIGRVGCVPELCLFFFSQGVLSIPYEGKGNKKAHQRKCRSPLPCPRHSRLGDYPPAINHLMKMMPSTCTPLGFQVYGTVGTAWDLSHSVELRNKTSLSVLMLPKISGVLIKPFVVHRDEFKRLGKLEHGLLTDEQLEELTGISTTEEVRCLIVFHDSPSELSAADAIIQTLLKRMDNKMAVGGGVPEEFSSSSPFCGPLLYGLAISGESVRAISAVIPENVNKASEIQETLEELKSCDLPSENCVGFMFTCYGRLVGKSNRTGVESSLFRKCFPTVPLIGFFGGGEIGHNCLLPCEYQDKSGSVNTTENVEPLIKRPKLTDNGMIHQYSTIFVLVSLKKGK